MPLAPDDFFGLVDDTNPRGTDSRTISDNQHLNILASLKKQCPNWTGPVNATHADVNTLTGLAAGGVKPMPGQGGVTVLFAYNADTPPLGWTVEEPDANLRNLVIGPQASGGTIGGVDDPTDDTFSVNINIRINGSTEITNTPHNHTLGAGVVCSTENTAPVGVATAADDTCAKSDHIHTITGTTGGLGDTQTEHNHSLDISDSDSDTIRIRPQYARGILMKLAV